MPGHGVSQMDFGTGALSAAAASSTPPTPPMRRKDGLSGQRGSDRLQPRPAAPGCSHRGDGREETQPDAGREKDFGSRNQMSLDKMRTADSFNHGKLQ